MQEEYGNDPIRVRVTSAQRSDAEQLAQHYGMNLSELLRYLLKKDFEAVFSGEQFSPDETRGQRKKT